MTRLLLAIWTLWLAAPALGHAPRAFQDPAPDSDPAPAARDLRETRLILKEILEQRSEADPALFEELGLRGDAEALDALERGAIAMLSPESQLDVYAAFRHFAGGPLERDAIEFVTEQCLAPAQPASTRARVRGLVNFGGSAAGELEQVLLTVGDLESRSLAIGALMTALRVRGDEVSLRLILDHFRPPLSGPRELGVRTLAGFRSEACAELLHDTLDDDHAPATTRTLVAEALVGSPHEDADRWLRDALRADSAVVRVAALEALGARGTSLHLRDVARLLRDKDPRVQRAAQVEHARLAPDDEARHERVVEAATHDDWARRLAAVELLGAADAPEEDHERLRALLEDEHPGVRGAAMDALGASRWKGAVEPLIAVLERDTLRLRERARRALGSLTGLDLGLSAPRWRSWWEAEGRDAPLPDPDEVAARLAARDTAGRTTAGFYGVPLGSDRVTFVLDTSGSMDTTCQDGSGRTRLEAVLDQLEQSLANYPEGGRFNLIFFADRPRKYEREQVEMDEGERKKSLRWIRRQKAKGGTALYDALVEALEDDQMDTIVVLSDGQPMGGTIDDPMAILEQVSDRAALRDVVVHAVSFRAPGTLLHDLAEATGGRYLEVR